MKSRTVYLAAAMSIAASMGVADAAPFNANYSFNATPFGPAGGPLSALTGTFQLTFDPTLANAFTSVGITELSLNLPVTAVGFQYNPNANNGNLMIGGTLNGVNVLAGTGAYDFSVSIINVKGTPALLGGAQYTTPASATVYGDLFQGTVSVPEPLTLSTFGAGLAGAAALRRRKAKKV
ncbi:MAG: PEP-CTERM sorting domain-containing protein [Alphaproteobacteria bacterium]|nr:PEP-CTERM sorting domain-containing protein [Alphaproteobacteria bacterium]